jgi:hypothetical protein
LDRSWGSRSGRRRWTAAPGGGHRGNGAPGVDAGSAEQPAALEAVVEGRCGECVHKWPSGGVEGGARRGRPWRRSGGLRCWSAWAHARGGLAALNRRWTDSLGADEDRPAHDFVLVGARLHGGAADQRGTTWHVAWGNFKAPRSAPSLGKRWPREGAGESGRQGSGTARGARGRTGAGVMSRSSTIRCGVA